MLPIVVLRVVIKVEGTVLVVAAGDVVEPIPSITVGTIDVGLGGGGVPLRIRSPRGVID